MPTDDTSERLDETAALPLVEDPEAVFTAVFGNETFAMGEEAFADGHLKPQCGCAEKFITRNNSPMPDRLRAIFF